jgi:hypothetical protein
MVCNETFLYNSMNQHLLYLSASIFNCSTSFGIMIPLTGMFSWEDPQPSGYWFFCVSVGVVPTDKSI